MSDEFMNFELDEFENEIALLRVRLRLTHEDLQRAAETTGERGCYFCALWFRDITKEPRPPLPKHDFILAPSGPLSDEPLELQTENPAVSPVPPTADVYHRFIEEVEALTITADWGVVKVVGELTRAVKRAQFVPPTVMLATMLVWQKPTPIAWIWIK